MADVAGSRVWTTALHERVAAEAAQRAELGVQFAFDGHLWEYNPVEVWRREA